MPRNSKPRKKYRPLNCRRLNTDWPVIGEIRDELTGLEYCAASKLHDGTITQSELANMRSWVNFTAFSLTHRQDGYNVDDANALIELSHDAGMAITSIYSEIEHRGKATVDAEKIATVSDAMSSIADYTRESLIACPMTTIIEINASLRLLTDKIRHDKAKGAIKYQVTKRDVDRYYSASVAEWQREGRKILQEDTKRVIGILQEVKRKMDSTGATA